MTPHFTYYPDPGIVYDISKMLLVKLNPQSTWTNLFTSPSNMKTDINHIQSCADALPDPKPELLLFSYIPTNRQTTFLTFAISNLLESGIHNFSVSQLSSYLNNYELVKNDLLRFYFDSPNPVTLDLDYAIHSNRTLPDKLKILLLTFWMNPQKYISSLIDVIHSYYAGIQKNLLPLSKDIDLAKFFSLLAERYMPEYESANKSTNFPEVAYSLSYCVPDYLAGDFTTVPPYFIVTELTINDFLLSQEAPPMFSQLIDLCNAIGDTIRMSILKELLIQNNLTIEEISGKIGLTITATKYHLSMLKKVGLLSTARVHRKIGYSFDPKGFKTIKNLLDLMEKGDLK